MKETAVVELLIEHGANKSVSVNRPKSKIHGFDAIELASYLVKEDPYSDRTKILELL